MTESEAMLIQGPLTPSEAETVRELDALHTIEGRLSSIEKACASVLEEAGLPCRPGGYVYDCKGNWREGRWGGPASAKWTNGPWPIAKQRGFAEDSKVGFAARMVKDISEVRAALANGDHEDVAMTMFYLGIKWAASEVKKRHGSKSGRRPKETSRNVELARQFQSRRKQNDRSPAAGRMSDSALMRAIGEGCTPPLRRSQAIKAINEGLEILSG